MRVQLFRYFVFYSFVFIRCHTFALLLLFLRFLLRFLFRFEIFLSLHFVLFSLLTHTLYINTNYFS